MLTQDNIQISLKAGKGPIMVVTCEVGSGATGEPKGDFFEPLEESRIKMTTLHTGRNSDCCAAVQQQFTVSCGIWELLCCCRVWQSAECRAEHIATSRPPGGASCSQTPNCQEAWLDHVQVPTAGTGCLMKHTWLERHGDSRLVIVKRDFNQAEKHIIMGSNQSRGQQRSWTLFMDHFHFHK